MPYNYFPAGYPCFPPQVQQQQAQQIQSSGFMLVPSEDIVNTYPVAPGNCVTFKIEGKPIVMEKSMGFSQLESPRIERYRLVKEEPQVPEEVPADNNYGGEIGRIWAEIEEIKKTIAKSTTRKKKEVTEDDAES